MLKHIAMGVLSVVFIMVSGLAQADRIASMSAWRVHPGQDITLHGQFTVDNFRSRQYRIIVKKVATPRSQGCLCGASLNAFRVSLNSAMIRIPKTWHGHPVYPGEYVLTIRDVIHNVTVFTGSPGGAGALIISPASGISKGSTVRRLQQQRFGNITHAVNRKQFARKVLGAGLASGTPQLKLMFDHVQDEQGHRLESVSSGDRVAVYFTVQNLGTAPATIYIRDLRGNRSLNRTIGPGQRGPNRLQMIVRKSEELRRSWSWTPSFTLYDGNSHSRYFNQPFRDSFRQDNTVQISGIKYNQSGDLTITELSIHLQMNRDRNGFPTDPEEIVVNVRVRNNDSIASSSRRWLHVWLKGLRSYTPAAVRTLPQYFPASPSREILCHGNGCPVEGSAGIPSIPPQASKLISVHIIGGSIGFTQWCMIPGKMGKAQKQLDEINLNPATCCLHINLVCPVGGYYTCPVGGFGEGPRIHVKAEVDTNNDDEPGNNGKVMDVSFGSHYDSSTSCGGTNASVLKSYTPR